MLSKQKDAVISGLMRDVKELKSALDAALARIDALEKGAPAKKKE